MAQTARHATTVSSTDTDTSSSKVSNAQQLVNGATQTVRKIKADSRFDTMLKQSKGVFIMPDVVQGAFIVGGTGAQGVLLKHNSDGTWSNPVFLTLGSVSVGAQVGGKAGPAAMILMTDKAVNDFTQSNNFSLNANAGLTVINYSATGQAPVGKGDIVVWSDQSGAFAGVNVSGADITQNSAQDHAYYGKQVDARQILSGGVSSARATKLKDALPA
jgi:lipid-binding SYLF domain-containing protein